MTITDAKGADGSSEPPEMLPPNVDPAGDDPAGETPTDGTGEDPAGEVEDDAHPAPTSATVAIAATNLAPVPIPMSPLWLTVGTCGRLIDGHRRCE
jgi:hypothetical protein